MRVVKPGREQSGWSSEQRCTGDGNGGGGCGAVLLVEQPDLYRTGRSSYDGSRDEFVTFTCACCGVETDIENCPGNVSSVLPWKTAWLASRPPVTTGKERP